ncbi:MAG: ATP-binding protein [Bacteroidetes bacterium]|nr:ATP-binding protein [Bacteroidota bacterium]
MIDSTLKNANILIVDDQETNIDILVGLLEMQGYTNIETTIDPRLVVGLFKSFNPDLILLDLMMPYLTGYEVMEQLKALIPHSTYLPILVLTADITVEAKQRALSCGAKDFITKPFDLIEVGLRIKNLLETHYLQKQLENQNYILEEKVKARTFELEETNIKLIAAKDKAEESDRLKTAFLNNISHEIRTPFSGILGFLSLIQDNDLTASERDEYISFVNKSANRLMNTINDIVEISQIQTGQMKVNVSETNISELTSGIYNHFKTDAESKGLKFCINNDLPINIEYIYIDSYKLNAILTILIGNAIKFTKTGSIEFGIKLKVACELGTLGGPVEPTEKVSAPAELVFFVKDTGVGIPENKQQAIFERFRQADGSNSRQFEGSGLGLSIAKAYVVMLGGKIWVESEEGKGSTFYFTILKKVEPEKKLSMSSDSVYKD